MKKFYINLYKHSYLIHFFKDETLYLNEDFDIEKVEKPKKTSKSAANEKDDDELESLKNLTFNVHLNPDDLEAKKKLVLPYELVG